MPCGGVGDIPYGQRVRPFIDPTARHLLSALCPGRRRAIVCGAIAGGLAVMGWMSQLARGQEVYPPNGLLVFIEAGQTPKGRTLVDVATSRGSLHTLSVAMMRDASTRIAPGADGRKAGKIWVDSLPGPFTLRIPRHPGSGPVTLLQHGTLRVTFVPSSKAANPIVLRVSGLAARTTHVEIELRGKGGPLIVSETCPSKPTFLARATRSGASSPASTKSGTQC
jgi:hypothetical protein